MKAFKLKVKHYGDLTQLLIDAGAVNKEGSVAYPNHVYISKEDMKKMKKEVTKLFKKEYPYIHGRKLQSSVAMHMLSYSPNESLAAAIKPGYLLVDEDMIESDALSDERAAVS